MRIRKRSHSVAATTPLPQPIVFKYHTGFPPPGSLARVGGHSDDECSNMQEQAYQCLEDLENHDEHPSDSPRFDTTAEPPAMDSLRLSDAHVKDDRDGDLSGPCLEDDDALVPDKVRRRQSSPKRRKIIEHVEGRSLYEGSASMTAAELLVVNELANGVRQRLHNAASEHSTTTEVTKTHLLSKPVENSKDALISSIFFVFGSCGENGLSASEVVKYMLDQRLPGLKEGGARHTVQVANVLRSSSSFISLGDKKYLLCSSLDVSSLESSRKSTSSRQQQPLKSSPASSSPGSPGSDGKIIDSSENEDVTISPQQQQPRIRAPPIKSPHSSTRTGRKPEAKPKAAAAAVLQVDERRPANLSDGEPELPVVVKTTRRRGPSSSQKGKGPTQCKRYDGRGWQCSRLTEPGYSLCVHHQDLINKRAAKLKEQQTLSRLMESQHRKIAKNQQHHHHQQQQQQQQQPPPPVETLKVAMVTESGNAAVKQSSRDRENSIPAAAPVQKRKMLSLLAIK